MTTATTETAATREALGPTLIKLADEGLDIVVVDADLGKSTTSRKFQERYPDRFFSVGVAEQNMIGVSCGLAAAGKIPFCSTFAVFLPGRCFDQIRVSVAQTGLGVKMVVSHGGISVGEDGISAHAIEDLALMCSLAGVTVIVPADKVEAEQAIETAARTPGPLYIRTGRPKIPIIYDDSYRFQLGKAHTLRPGKDVTVIAVGIMVTIALDAAAQLEQEGIDCRVLNMATLRPMDDEAIVAAARDTGAIVTAEEHQIGTGVAAMVSRVVGSKHPVPMGAVGMRDRYAESGRWGELLEKYGLTAEAIAREAKGVLARKTAGDGHSMGSR
ncbi:MAG: transketolase C-terminal domain-containing protein [Dehalococcoidia bacterium]|nr:transketolase C-terminal domain-containing protein [Dehalococcoidia bacterium]MDZ4278625.1 transketolase C-terminal domain-containing protein [Dehalococcoidia bacterium]